VAFCFGQSTKLAGSGVPASVPRSFGATFVDSPSLADISGLIRLSLSDSAILREPANYCADGFSRTAI
jgi:hypothetical protein